MSHVARRRLHYSVFAAFTATSIAIFAMFYSLAGGPNPFAGHRYTVTVLLDQPLQLVPNSEVLRAGIQIGKVTGISGRGALAAATIQLDPGQGPIYADATVQPRFRSPLGETALWLDPGAPPAARIPDRGELPLQQTTETVPIDKVLDTLDAQTRYEVRRMLHSVGASLAGRGDQLNAALGATPDLVDRSTSLFSILDQQRGELAALVSDTGAVLDAISARQSQLRRLITAASTTARAVAARDTELGRTIDELPGALHQATAATVTLGRLARDGTPVVRNLRAASVDLGPAVRHLGPAALDGVRLLSALRPALTAANPVVARLRSFATVAGPALDRLGPMLDQLAPFVGYLAPYAKDFGAEFASQSGAWDTDHGCGPTPTTKWMCDWEYGNVAGIVGANSFAAYTPQQQQLISALEKQGVLQPGTGATVQANAYPEPGTVGAPSRAQRYSILQPFPASRRLGR